MTLHFAYGSNMSRPHMQARCPGAAPLGWHGFAALRECTGMPVYALGGLTMDDLATARAHGAQGIAAIRGLWPQTE